MKVELEKMGPDDQVLIKTNNSEYKFSVVDPAERRGTLTGGSLGDQRRDAVLVGTLTGKSDQPVSDTLAVKEGVRALFYMAARNGIERLITSVITDIVYLKGHGVTRRVA
jgi:hypothetical protein